MHIAQAASALDIQLLIIIDDCGNCVQF